MQFKLEKTIQLIERTPAVLNALLSDVPDEWIHQNEGENTWSAFEAVGHLIVCEKTDFIPRAKILLSDQQDKMLQPLDMKAHIQWSKGKTMNDLLAEFEGLRKENIMQLRSMKLTESDLQQTATHPVLGVVTLRDLLATWAPHDLGHLSQITRVMAKQYRMDVGPFKAFLGILKR